MVSDSTRIPIRLTRAVPMSGVFGFALAFNSRWKSNTCENILKNSLNVIRIGISGEWNYRHLVTILIKSRLSFFRWHSSQNSSYTFFFFHRLLEFFSAIYDCRHCHFALLENCSRLFTTSGSRDVEIPRNCTIYGNLERACFCFFFHLFLCAAAQTSSIKNFYSLSQTFDAAVVALTQQITFYVTPYALLFTIFEDFLYSNSESFKFSSISLFFSYKNFRCLVTRDLHADNLNFSFSNTHDNI